MAKKYFEAPYLKVVGVHNDIIATSGEFGFSNSQGNSIQLAGERADFDEDEYEDWK